MHFHRDVEFSSLFDRGDRLVLEDHYFEGCSFANCGFSLTKDIACRSTARRIEIVNCKLNGCYIGAAILEDIKVDDLKTNDLQIFWGSVFRHVVFSGNIGKVKINPFVDPVDRSPAAQRPFDEHREHYYEVADWALNISQARFSEFDVRGIPSKLIRLDPESQAVVTRQRAMRPGWRDKVSPWNKLWPFMIDLFLKDGDPDMVLVVPLGAPKAKRGNLLRGLRELRSLGVIDPI